MIIGLANLQMGRFSEAVVHFEAASNLMISDWREYLAAEARFHMGEYKEAHRRFRRFIKKYPRSLWVHRARFRLGDSLMGMRHWAQARRNFKENLERYPEYPHPVSLRLALAETELRRGRGRAAAGFLDESLRRWPAEALSALAEAGLKALKGRGISAPKVDLQLLYKQGISLRRRKYFPQALALFQKISEDKRCNSGMKRRVRYQQGRTYYQMERYEEARKLFAGLGKGGSGASRRQAHRWRSRVLADMGRVKEAVKALHLAQNEPTRLSREQLIERAELYFNAGDYKNAQRDYSKAPPGRWKRSWLAWRQGKFKEAEQGFARLKRRSRKRPQRYAYWQAQALMKLKRPKEAEALYREILEKQPLSYYALQARSRLEDQGLPVERLLQEPASPTKRADPYLALRALELEWGEGIGGIGRALEYAVVGEEQMASIELRMVSDEIRAAQAGRLYRPRPFVDNRAPERQRGEWGRELDRRGPKRSGKQRRLLRGRKSTSFYRNILAAFEALDDRHYSRRYLPRAERPQLPFDPQDLRWSRRYPRPYRQLVEAEASRYGLDPLLVWAFMIVESAYNPRAISRASARGLMQVMPHTGALIAHNMGFRNFGTPMIFEPEVGVPMAVWYIHQLLKKFRGQWLLAMAGYNAGPHRVASWLRAKGELPMDEFVEEIPYPEAREYCKKVLRHLALYRRIYDGSDRILLPLKINRKYRNNINF